MSDILGRLLRNALLCGALGPTLYGALISAVMWPGFAPLLALLMLAEIGSVRLDRHPPNRGLPGFPWPA